MTLSLLLPDKGCMNSGISSFEEVKQKLGYPLANADIYVCQGENRGRISKMVNYTQQLVFYTSCCV
jgi:hypothetical protein